MKKFLFLVLLALVSSSRDTISDVNNSTPQLEQSVYGCDPINTPQKWAKLNTMEEINILFGKDLKIICNFVKIIN